MRDTPATIYIKTPAVNAAGIKISGWSPLYTQPVIVGWQPANLNPTLAKEWGISSQASDAKRMFFDNDSNIKTLQRVTVPGDSNTYEILGINVWRMHSEALLKKVEGQ